MTMQMVRLLAAPLRRGARTTRDERAQGLVEYALIISVVALGTILALTFLRDEIRGLFSKTGSSISSAAGLGGDGGVPPTPPPASGTPVTIPWDPPGPIGPINITYYYLGPGVAVGSAGSPSGLEGFYTTFVTSPPGPTTFDVGGWTFNCTWHTPGVWNYPGPGDPFFSACYNTAGDTTPPAVTITAPTSGATGVTRCPDYSGARGNAPGDISTVTVRVYAGPTATGSVVFSGTDGGTGTWTVEQNLITRLAANTQYTARASQDDAAGNTGTATTTFTTGASGGGFIGNTCLGT